MNLFTRFIRSLSEDASSSVTIIDPISSINKSIASDIKNPYVAGAMSATYTTAVKDRSDYVEQFEEIKNMYLTDTLIGNICEDTLTPDISTGEILKVSSPNETYNNELVRLQEKFDLDNIVNEFVSDLLSYGEYALRLEVEDGKGVKQIIDDVDQTKLIGLYKEGYPEKFLILSDDDSKINIMKPHQYAHFILSSRKIKFNLDNLIDKYSKDEKLNNMIREIPRQARIGRPLLYGVISKIKELDLLEKLVPALKLADITSGSIVSVEVPPTTDPKTAFDIARDYENLFNSKVSKDSSGMLGAVDILAQAGRMKVIPSFSNKGNLQAVDVKGNSTVNDIMNSIKDIRDVICTSIGYPSELLYGGASKSEVLKKYARYLRKVKSIQKAIANGIVQISLAHLKNIPSTKDVSVKDIKVDFLNEIVNIDELEKLEYQDTAIGFTRNTIEFINGLEENELYKDVIDKDELKAFIKDKLSFLSYNDNKLKDRNKLDNMNTRKAISLNKNPNDNTLID